MYRVPTWVTKTRRRNGDFALYNWRNGELAILFDENHPVYKYLESERWSGTASDVAYSSDIDWLVSSGLLQAVDAQSPPVHVQSVGNHDLHLVLFPAGEACNLNCVYCYEDHSDSRRMSEPHVSSIVALCRKENKRAVHIEYFGGEPLLNISFMERLAAGLCGAGIDYSASVTTNGTLLTNQVLKRLYDSGVKKFQITLDGPRTIHNSLRPCKNHELDSFTSVCSGLRVLAESKYRDLSVIVRLNYNEEMRKKNNISAFISALSDIFKPTDERFYVFPKAISDYSRANLKENKEAEAVYCARVTQGATGADIEQAISDAGFGLADAAFLARDRGYACYAGQSNSFVITPDWTVRKCTVAINDEVNKVGELKENGVLSLNENFDLWIRNYSNPECDSCFLERTCSGNSCPLVNIKSGRAVCPPAKAAPEYATEKIVSFVERNEVNDEI